MRRQQRIEPGVALTWREARHIGNKPVAPPRHGLDEGDVARMHGELPAQARNGLLEAVVAHGHVLPTGLDQIVLRDNLTSPLHEKHQHVELAIGHRHRLTGHDQTPFRWEELERLEPKAHTGRHGATATPPACPGWELCRCA